MPTRGKTDSQKAWKPDCGIETHKASGIHVDIPRQKAWKPDCGIETADGGYVRRRVGLCQKAWKPDCGIETQKFVDCHCYFCSVRRPGSPIAGLKPLNAPTCSFCVLRQKAWKPDCGIETSHGSAAYSSAWQCQKAWKPDCGIETCTHSFLQYRRGKVRRPGSPIAGLKPFCKDFYDRK